MPRTNLPPRSIEPGAVTFLLQVEPLGTSVLEISAACEVATDVAPSGGFDEALAAVRSRRAGDMENACRVVSSSTTFNRWMTRSQADLQMMLTDSPQGLYPYAGIPWFSTPFGRDGLVTAFDVLSFLAATQATAYSDALRHVRRDTLVRDARCGLLQTDG